MRTQFPAGAITILPESTANWMARLRAGNGKDPPRLMAARSQPAAGAWSIAASLDKITELTRRIGISVAKPGMDGRDHGALLPVRGANSRSRASTIARHSASGRGTAGPAPCPAYLPFQDALAPRPRRRFECEAPAMASDPGITDRADRSWRNSSSQIGSAQRNTRRPSARRMISYRGRLEVRRGSGW